jgi:hypothetical protein
MYQYAFNEPVHPQHGMPVFDGADEYQMIQLVQTATSGEYSW